MKIAFIGCCGPKLQTTCKARDIYISTKFKTSLKYCLKNFDKVYILSALYGVVDLDEVISYYNLRLKKREILWENKVMEQLKTIIKDEDELYFFVGKNYRGFVDRLRNPCFAPLKEKRIGEQIKFFKENI